MNMLIIYYKLISIVYDGDVLKCFTVYFVRASPCIGVATITQLRTCVIKIVTFKGGHLMW